MEIDVDAGMDSDDGADYFPTLMELHRAIEQPTEAKKATLRYLEERPKLVKQLQDLGKEPSEGSFEQEEA